MKECKHVFCNACWELHLETQIHQGQTNIMCPEFNCDIRVDDITIMALVPNWYSRYITRKINNHMELNPEWQWCPGDQCKLVVKATTSQNPSLMQQEVRTRSPMPVVCVCGKMWCSQCKEDAHWPASCDEAQKFREKTKGYRDLFQTRREKLITSVLFKHCPSCYYPIEKSDGCPHMVCGICFKDFCWDCLSKWEGHGWPCPSTRKGHKKAELPSHLDGLVSLYEHIAITSHIARSSSANVKEFKKRAAKEKKLTVNSDTHDAVCRPLGISNANAAVELLKEAFDFKYQASLTLEGAAIVLGLSQRRSRDRKLDAAVQRLLFIVTRVEEFTSDSRKPCKFEDLQSLEQFLGNGKKCVFAISRHVSRSKSHVHVC